MVTLRPATAGDGPLLVEMLALAVAWRPGAVAPSSEEIAAAPDLAHYVAGWPRPGDHGVVAEAEGVAIGAAWWRRFTSDDPGYGFVDESTPEVSLAVRPEARARGVGSVMLGALLDDARRTGVGALSLSVELDNRARGLYERVGFLEVDRSPTAATMVVRLAD